MTNQSLLAIAPSRPPKDIIMSICDTIHRCPRPTRVHTATKDGLHLHGTRWDLYSTSLHGPGVNKPLGASGLGLTSGVCGAALCVVHYPCILKANRDHRRPNRQRTKDRMITTINSTGLRNGKTLFPVAAVCILKQITSLKKAKGIKWMGKWKFGLCFTCMIT